MLQNFLLHQFCSLMVLLEPLSGEVRASCVLLHTEGRLKRRPPVHRNSQEFSQPSSGFRLNLIHCLPRVANRNDVLADSEQPHTVDDSLMSHSVKCCLTVFSVVRGVFFTQSRKGAFLSEQKKSVVNISSPYWLPHITWDFICLLGFFISINK